MPLIKYEIRLNTVSIIISILLLRTNVNQNKESPNYPFTLYPITHFTPLPQLPLYPCTLLPSYPLYPFTPYSTYPPCSESVG